VSINDCVDNLVVWQVPAPKIALDGSHLTFVGLAAVLRHVTQRTITTASGT
jgi:hypothetical protein